ncbi:MAG: periplasmic heavy metal sensor [Desulfohalobium sp.]
MTRWTISAAFTLGVVLLAATAWAAPGYGSGKGTGPNCPNTRQQGTPGIFAQIPPEQHAAVQEMLQTHQQKAFVLKQKVVSSKAALRSVVADPDSSQKDVDQAVETVNDARAKLLEERTAFQRKLQQETGLAHLGGYGRGSDGFQGHGRFGPNAGHKPCWR